MRSCSFEVDNQLKFGRLHDGEIDGFLTLENSAGVNTDLAITISKVCAITDQATSRDELALRVDRGQLIACRQRNELIAPCQEERISVDEKRGGAPFAQRRKDRIDFDSRSLPSQR